MKKLTLAVTLLLFPAIWRVAGSSGMGGLASACLGPPEPSAAGGPAGLDFVEMRAIRLPDSVPVTSGALAPDESIAVLAIDGSLWSAKRERDSVDLVLRHPGARAVGFTSDGLISLLIDDGRFSLVHVNADGETVEETQLSLEGHLVTGTESDGAWHIVTRTASGTHVVSVVEPVSGTIAQTFELGGSNEVAWATQGWQGALASEAGSPFTTGQVGTRDGHARAFRPLVAREVAEALGVPERWRASALHPVAGGYLQVLADLTSDARLVIRLTEAHEVAAATRIQAPVGLLDTCVATRTVLMIRRTDRLEAVVYRWAESVEEVGEGTEGTQQEEGDE